MFAWLNAELGLLAGLLVLAAVAMLRGLTGLYAALYGGTNPDALTVNGGLTVGAGGLTVTGPATLPAATTFGANSIPAPGVAAPVAIPAATTTLTLSPAAHANRIVTVASTGGLAITPPPATGTGNIYTIAVSTTVTGGSLTIDAKAGNASDVFYGNCVMNKVGTGITTFGTAANSNLYTANGTTTGGITGDVIEMIDLATHVWAIFISGQGSSTIATPFSNH